SSRVGAVAVAMESPVCGAPVGWNGVPNARAEGPADQLQPPESRWPAPKTAVGIRMGGAKYRAFGTMVRSGALYAKARAGLCPPTRGAVNRALGPLGWPRRCRWRPGWPRLYPNASYRASARPALVSGGPPHGSGRVDPVCEYRPARPPRRYDGLAPGIRRRGGEPAP